MILSDRDIRACLASWEIIIETEQSDIQSQIGPASFDFRLGNIFRFYKRGHLTVIDPSKDDHVRLIETVEIPPGEVFILHPGQFILGTTCEKITIGRSLVARCEWRSSLGRLGLIIHSTAGFIDPGFSWTITLEITNINEIPIALYPGMRIGQFAFERLSTPSDVSYAERKGSKYMHQKDSCPSMVSCDWEWRAQH